jgi:hypothetical protein
MKRIFALAVLTACLHGGALAQSAKPAVPVCGTCIRSHMEFLASDALRGRKSGSHEELIAATYVASEMQRNSIEPAGTQGYLQPVNILNRKAKGKPTLTFTSKAGDRIAQFEHSGEMLVIWASDPVLTGPLQKYDANVAAEPPLAGSIVMLTASTKPGSVTEFTQALDLVQSGVKAVMLRADADLKRDWTQMSAGAPPVATQIEGGTHTGSVLVLSDSAWEQVSQMPEGTKADLTVEMTEPQPSTTWNVVGKLTGSDPDSRAGAVVLGAHIDHIGVGTGDGDQIYNGADDNASGVSMVLELMRELARMPRPKRTVMFAFFGSEERGGLGAAYFREHPPVLSRNIAVVLNFDMVSRPTLAGNGKLVLTGSERSTIASALMKHSATIVGDTEKTKGLFERSDSYILTRNGTVAHTLISSGVHADYHKPSDDITKVDFAHMETAVSGLLPALDWLLNSDFRPHWEPGCAPVVISN